MLPPSIENAVYGIIVTPALHTAACSGILSRLVEPGHHSAREIAASLSTDPDTTERVLLVLTAAGIIDRDPDGGFSVPDANTRWLDPASGDFIGGFVQHLIEEALPQLTDLDRHLAPANKKSVESTLTEPYEHFYRDDESTTDFMNAMWSLSYGVSRELTTHIDFANYTTLLDVGGANGPFAVAALDHAPHLRAIVFDLPDVAPHLMRTRATHNLAERLSFMAGDFFIDDFPSADLIAMGYVMSNWPDEQCLTLLRKAHAACNPGGAVLIMDRLFNDSKTGPMATAAMHLTMLLETHGVHRTAAEFGALLEKAGFSSWQVHRSSRDKHLVLAHR